MYNRKGDVNMKLNCLVLFGGESVEHEISVLTAHQAIENLDKNKYEVIPVYISKNSEFYTSDLLKGLANYGDLDALCKQCTKIVFYQKDGQAYFKALKTSLFDKSETRIDVALPCVHGTNGEDGVLQGLLQMYHIPYAGCDNIAAAIGQDKVHMKQILESEHLPITKWTWFYAHEFIKNNDAILDHVEKSVGYPCVVKPSNLGSSIAIHVAEDRNELSEYIDEACQYDFKVIVEKKVEHLREINASVIGNIETCKVATLEEVGMNNHGKLLDYSLKYEGGNKGGKLGSKVGGSKNANLSTGSKGMASTDRQVPANLSDKNTQLIQSLAKKVFRTLGSSGVCRIDFMLNDATKEIYVNEINTIPGSLSYYLWEATNLSFKDELDELIQLALKRDQDRKQKIFSYDTNILQSYAKK